MRKVLVVVVVIALLCTAYFAGARNGFPGKESRQPVHEAGTRFKPGDTAIVTTNRVELRDGERTLARLGKDCRIHIQKVSGSWAGGTVQIRGETVFGWVDERFLSLLEGDVKPDVKPATPALVSSDKAFVPPPVDTQVRQAPSPPASAPASNEPAQNAGDDIQQMSAAMQLSALNASRSMHVVVAREPADLQQLESLPVTERLIVTGETFTNESLRPLVGRTIVTLSIECPDISNGGLHFISGVKGLKALRLWALGINDSGLEFVTKMDELESLDLEGTGVQGEGLTRLENLPRLTHLTLGPKTTDNALGSLKGLAHLTDLDLRPCFQLTEESFQALSQVGSLRTLRLPSRLVEKGAERLRQVLPNCVVRE